jgi:hypothetical protein
MEPATGNVKIKAEDLKHKMRSKEDWYKFLKYTCKFLLNHVGGFVVPSFKKISMRFIKDFLSGKKQLIPSKDANNINVPQYPELSVSNVFEQVKSSDEVMLYLDYYEDAPELPERWYFYTVVGTVAPDYLKNLIQR